MLRIPPIRVFQTPAYRTNLPRFGNDNARRDIAELKSELPLKIDNPLLSDPIFQGLNLKFVCHVTNTLLARIGDKPVTLSRLKQMYADYDCQQYTYIFTPEYQSAVTSLLTSLDMIDLEED